MNIYTTKKEHASIVDMSEIRQEVIIEKLKEQIAKKGYYEDLGSKEYNHFKSWLNNKRLTYNVVAQHLDSLQAKIDQL